MNEDTHAQANAEQIRLLREALGEVPPAGEAVAGPTGEGPGLAAAPAVEAEVGVS